MEYKALNTVSVWKSLAIDMINAEESPAFLSPLYIYPISVATDQNLNPLFQSSSL